MNSWQISPDDPVLDWVVPFVRSDIGFIDDPLGRISLNLFCAGCEHNCLGCCNPELQDPNAGKATSVRDLIVVTIALLLPKLVESIVFLGGDWGLYPEQTKLLARAINLISTKERRYGTVLYTGYGFADLDRSLTEAFEILVTGPYRQDLPGIFPASTNQQVYINGVSVEASTLPLYATTLQKRGERDKHAQHEN